MADLTDKQCFQCFQWVFVWNNKKGFQIILSTIKSAEILQIYSQI